MNIHHTYIRVVVVDDDDDDDASMQLNDGMIATQLWLCAWVLFLGVDGQHKHELDSPSFYNDTEVRILFFCSYYSIVIVSIVSINYSFPAMMNINVSSSSYHHHHHIIIIISNNHHYYYYYYYFIIDQIDEVVSICSELVQQTKISPADIGVIAAFRQQVLKIRVKLRQYGQGLSNVNVGSVEDFQVSNKNTLDVVD